MDVENKNGASVDNEDNNNNDEINTTVVPTTVVPLEVKHVRRRMEVGRTSIQTRAPIIGRRLKQPMLEIKPFLHTEMLGNSLTLALLVNHGPQVESNTSDHNAKRHKQLHTRNVDGQFRFEIRNESSEIEDVDETMVTKMQSWEIMNKNWMRAIQTTTMTVKKHLMIWTYKFGNYP